MRGYWRFIWGVGETGKFGVSLVEYNTGFTQDIDLCTLPGEIKPTDHFMTGLHVPVDAWSHQSQAWVKQSLRTCMVQHQLCLQDVRQLPLPKRLTDLSLPYPHTTRRDNSHA